MLWCYHGYVNKNGSHGRARCTCTISFIWFEGVTRTNSEAIGIMLQLNTIPAFLAQCYDNLRVYHVLWSPFIIIYNCQEDKLNLWTEAAQNLGVSFPSKCALNIAVLLLVWDSNEEDGKDVSLVSVGKVLWLTAVHQGEAVQRGTSYLINSLRLSSKQQALAKGLHWCQLPPLLIWFLTSSLGPGAVSQSDPGNFV